ncbi:MAG TPA: hypothetical protein ACFCUC_14680 [Desulfobacterales bacterium]
MNDETPPATGCRRSSDQWVLDMPSSVSRELRGGSNSIFRLHPLGPSVTPSLEAWDETLELDRWSVENRQRMRSIAGSVLREVSNEKQCE